MKIAVTSTGPTLDNDVEARFGRCAYFLIIDTDTMQFEAIENPNMALGGGAGIQSAQLMSEKGVKTVLTGNCGPNAFNVFGQAGINVIVGVSGNIRKAVEQFKLGNFASAEGPNVQSHFGVGTVPPPSGTPLSGSSNPGGGNPGMGRGMGMGGGRGMGRGMGQGGGRGMGMGGGRGRGMGMGLGDNVFTQPGAVQPGGLMPPPTAGPVQPEQELAMLRARAHEMGTQLKAINARIDQIEQGNAVSALIAVVDAEKCTTCGLCQHVCPTGAISLREIAQIDQAKCTGCGLCVNECPQGAISLKKAS